ncbi:MAG: HicB family protein [Pedosphaera sp. Tous-C6FEB]|nr:MAG: HicB family protein [Pedosphaera sp. Tous-C6FEB]
MKTLFDYHVVCHRDDNGSCVAYVPAIAGCHAVGPTPELAQQELHNVFEMISEEFTERGLRSPGMFITR